MPMHKPTYTGLTVRDHRLQPLTDHQSPKAQRRSGNAPGV